MSKINTEKIKNELAKGDIEEQIKAFFELKDFVSQLILAEQKIKEQAANELQNTYDRINNN
jgi:hypothetical protein